jgi:hypothetical protein
LTRTSPGTWRPCCEPSANLARARHAEGDGDQPAAAAFAAAVASLRENSTPYHLAHGLLDHAEYLTRHGHPDAATLAVDEARAIASHLRFQPLLDRADALERAQPPIRA